MEGKGDLAAKILCRKVRVQRGRSNQLPEIILLVDVSLLYSYGFSTNPFVLRHV